MKSTSDPGLSLAELVGGLPLSYTLITLRHPRTGQVIQFERHHEHSQRSLAIVLQPIYHNGEQIGQVELHAASLKPSALFAAAQAVHDKIHQALDLNTQESALAA